MGKARKEIRALMDGHADFTARAAVVAAHDLMLADHLTPALTRSQSILDTLDEIRAKAAELVKATSRIPGAGKMSAKRKEAIQDFEESQKFVAAIAQRKRLTLIGSNSSLRRSTRLCSRTDLDCRLDPDMERSSRNSRRHETHWKRKMSTLKRPCITISGQDL